MSEPVSDARLTELWQIVGDFALLADDYRDIRLALRELQSLRRERAEQETLLAERNRQAAAAFGECDRLRTKLEDIALDYDLEDGRGSSFRGDQIREFLAAMGAKEGPPVTSPELQEAGRLIASFPTSIHKELP